MHPRSSLPLAVVTAAALILTASPAIAARADVEDAGSMSLDAPRKLKLGISIPKGRDISELDTFQASIGGTRSATWTIWTNFNDPAYRDFPTAAAEGARARGAVPIVWWSPASRNKNIIDGMHDDYIRDYARDAETFGTTVLLRFAGQGNADYLPWGWDYSDTDDNTVATYKAMWRHVHSIFQDEGADNVKFVWSIATQTCAGNCLKRPLGYPGNGYVDYLGFTWENWGEAPPGSDRPSEPWISMKAGFRPIVDRLKKVSGKPIIAVAIATAPEPGNKARWIRRGYKAVYRKIRRVKAIMYLNADLRRPPLLDRDWSLHGAPLRAYAAIAAKPWAKARFK
jgi:hypothetical protein